MNYYHYEGKLRQRRKIEREEENTSSPTLHTLTCITISFFIQSFFLPSFLNFSFKNHENPFPNPLLP